MKVILIGVNHAGTSFIRTLKSVNKKVTINAYDRNDNISFLGCGIALWVAGEFSNPAGLFYATKDLLTKKFKANIKMQHDVVEVNTRKKYVVVRDLKTGKEFKDKYDKLVYAGGSWPIPLNLPGRDLKNIQISKIYQHAQIIAAKRKDRKIKNVVVVGGGYIGLELVEAFATAGKKVTLIDSADRVISNYFDKEFTDYIEKQMKKDKITLALNETVKEFVGNSKNEVEKVVTNKGSYKADFVILAVGFKPNTELLAKQVKRLENGAIITNTFQQTSNKDVYAIGDSAAIKHNIFGKANVALATNAVKTGIIAALHINGGKIPFPGANGTNAIHVFGYKYASTGISEHVAKMHNIKHAVSFVVDKEKPGFMRVNEDVWFKIVYDPKTLKLLGAQIGSSNKTDHTETIYALSLAISKGMTLPEIALMDVFFLPHFNQPFNFIIKSILNVLKIKY